MKLLFLYSLENIIVDLSFASLHDFRGKIVEDFMDLLNLDVNFNLELIIRLAASAISLILVFIFKLAIAKNILTLLSKTLRNGARENLESYNLRLAQPLSRVLFMIFLVFMIPLWPLSLRSENFLLKLSHSCLIIFFAQALLVVVEMLISSLLAKNKVNSALDGKKNKSSALNYLGIILKTVIFVFAVFVVLEQWMDNVQSLIAGLGIGGLAIALAAQDTAANLVAGLAIMLDKPFDLGDWVETGSGATKVAGSVEEIGIRSCRVRAVDGALLTVPNSIMGTNVVINGTTRPIRFVDNTIPLDSGTTYEQLEKFREAVQRILSQDDGVWGEANLHFVDFERGAYIYQVRYNTSDNFAEFLETKSRVNIKILELIQELDIEVAKNIEIISK